MGFAFHQPVAPTASLPLLSHLATCSLGQISQALQNLRSIYIDPPTITGPTGLFPNHILQDGSVPDSGYASEEDGEEYILDGDGFDPDVLRSDTFERDFVVRWLTGFTARSDIWVSAAPSEDDADARTALVDSVASLLGFFNGGGAQEDEDLTRDFTFLSALGQPVRVMLNDAPIDNADHTSVGLQSWASAIVLSERLCASPSTFDLQPSADAEKPLRVLELGAGTGLLAIATAKLFAMQHGPEAAPATVVATDFHPNVLANLQVNVDSNFGAAPSCLSVLPLDWEHPKYEGALAEPFDVILAADVVYHPQHARWIRDCTQRLLKPGGVFWLIIALRLNGRHEHMSEAVREVFPPAREGMQGEQRLAMLTEERLGRHDAYGRADESGYVLYKVGWA